MLRDRKQGGGLLAQELRFIRAHDPIVLGVTRGGLPVASEVARALAVPLDFVAVQKVGAPEFPEYTIAAVAEGGETYVRRSALREVGMTDAEAAALAAQAVVELARRVRTYRGDAPTPDLAGRTIVLVDDGVATGATACAAVRAVRRRGAARVVLAAPVIAEAAVPELRHDVDELVALDQPHPLVALGIWYERFERVSDEEVLLLLRLGGEHLPRREADRIWNGEPPPRASGEPAAGPVTEVLSIPCQGAPPFLVDADLVLPIGARGIVAFSTGSTRESPRYRLISRALHEVGIATLRFDLLTPTERRAMRHPADPKVLASRIATVVRWVSAHPTARGMQRGLYGAGAGAEAALLAMAGDRELVEAAVIRAGQLDVVPTPTLASVVAPVLLVVGSRDQNVLSANRAALAHLATSELAVVPGATDLFGEPGALEVVARLAAEWFKRWLERAALRGPAQQLEVTQEPGAPLPGR